MNIKMVVHTAEEGSYGAGVPALPGRMMQAETIGDLAATMHEAVRAWFAADGLAPEDDPKQRVVELQV